MATLKVHIIKMGLVQYFEVSLDNLNFRFNKIEAIQFEHNFTKKKEMFTIGELDSKGEIINVGSISYQPGHVDYFYFSFSTGKYVKRTHLVPDDFKEGSTLVFITQKYRRNNDMLSDLIMEKYELLPCSNSSHFLNKNKFKTFEEFYWKMKYLLLKPKKTWDKLLPAGYIYIQSSFGK